MPLLIAFVNGTRICVEVESYSIKNGCLEVVYPEAQIYEEVTLGRTVYYPLNSILSFTPGIAEYKNRYVK